MYVIISPKYSLTRRLLQFHHLLVSKLRSVVHYLEGVVGVAVLAEGWLRDASTLNLGRGRVTAHIAKEESLAQLWDQL